MKLINFEFENRPLLIEKQLQINAYDIDVMSIVSNLVYIRWFEDLRYVLLDQYCPIQELLSSGISPILSHTSVDYKIPLTMFDRPVGKLWVSELRKARWSIQVEIVSDAGIHCCGTQTGYFYDLERKRPVRIPAILHQKYDEWMAQNCKVEK